MEIHKIRKNPGSSKLLGGGRQQGQAVKHIHPGIQPPPEQGILRAFKLAGPLLKTEVTT